MVTHALFLVPSFPPEPLPLVSLCSTPFNLPPCNVPRKSKTCHISCDCRVWELKPVRFPTAGLQKQSCSWCDDKRMKLNVWACVSTNCGPFSCWRLHEYQAFRLVVVLKCSAWFSPPSLRCVPSEMSFKV